MVNKAIETMKLYEPTLALSGIIRGVWQRINSLYQPVVIIHSFDQTRNMALPPTC